VSAVLALPHYILRAALNPISLPASSNDCGTMITTPDTAINWGWGPDHEPCGASSSHTCTCSTAAAAAATRKLLPAVSSCTSLYDGFRETFETQPEPPLSPLAWGFTPDTGDAGAATEPEPEPEPLSPVTSPTTATSSFSFAAFSSNPCFGTTADDVIDKMISNPAFIKNPMFTCSPSPAPTTTTASTTPLTTALTAPSAPRCWAHPEDGLEIEQLAAANTPLPPPVPGVATFDDFREEGEDNDVELAHNLPNDKPSRRQFDAELPGFTLVVGQDINVEEDEDGVGTDLPPPYHDDNFVVVVPFAGHGPAPSPEPRSSSTSTSAVEARPRPRSTSVPLRPHCGWATTGGSLRLRGGSVSLRPTSMTTMALPYEQHTTPRFSYRPRGMALLSDADILDKLE